MRILKYPWHTAHDYELCKLPHEMWLLADTHRRWARQTRPVPNSARFVCRALERQPDVVILHVDQWILQEPDKLFLFERMKHRFNAPKIVINHGCNMVDGCTSEEMRELLDGLPVVCNSETALRLWDLPNSRYIRHGMSPEEWPQTTYGRHNIIVTQPAGKSHAAYRNNDAITDFEKRRGVHVDWIGRDHHFKCFDEYRNFLRGSSIYFNPSYASVNPRARTEAMLCGLAVVTTAAHGEFDYIQHGVNGFASNDMEELFDILGYLAANPRVAEEVGRRGRVTAQKLFHIDSFLAQWETLLREVVGYGHI